MLYVSTSIVLKTTFMDGFFIIAPTKMLDLHILSLPVFDERSRQSPIRSVVTFNMSDDEATDKRDFFLNTGVDFSFYIAPVP